MRYQSGRPTSASSWINNKTQGLTDATLYLWNKGSALPIIFHLQEQTEHRCFTIVSQFKITSPCSEGALLTDFPSWCCCCHLSISSVPRAGTWLLSLSGTPQVKKCVAWATARTACPNETGASLTSPSALACLLEMRLVRSLWENTFSRASEAFLFKSNVLCHDFPASTQIASWEVVYCRIL